MSLENSTKESDRQDITLGCTEGYFSTQEDAGKRSEKRKIKNQSTKKGSFNQINYIILFMWAFLS